MIISIFLIAGHVFSIIAIARIPVTTVRTIKALLLLYTEIAFAGLFGGWIRFLCEFGSMIVFVSQSIFERAILPSSSSLSSQKHKQPISSSSSCNQINKLNPLFSSSVLVFFLMILLWIWFGPRVILFSLELIDLVPSSSEHNPDGLSIYFTTNSTVSFVQYILAFTISSQTSLVMYSIESLIKWVVLIVILIAWFQQNFSSIQFFGIILSFFGLYIYNQTELEIDRGEKNQENQVLGDSFILPMHNIKAK
ncbi:hypothetical protein PPACK8108_LOCUS15224 [Phakopsora pachyrhizi]|uniref:Sugar phosphate transporter domain-containing protein n=1 Tax=Phakopsora pachyrhizi TaxID=170000 RepID=A0AAV0B619_PHAPC|nr:hypothetical protein PPACK8108_LOCUS15224 [Phakopsora pachyrhizi]